MSNYRGAGGLLKDYYGLLGLARGASRAEVNLAFKRVMARYAPRLDPRTIGDPSLRAEYELSYQLRMEKAREVNEAYEVLTDPRRRAEYDALVDGRGNGHGPARGVQLLADPPFLQFGVVMYDAPVLEFRLIAEPLGQLIPPDLRITAPSWLEVQADGLGWGGYPAVSPLRLRVRLLPERMFSHGLIQDRILITWTGGRLSIDVTALLPVAHSGATTPSQDRKASSHGDVKPKRAASPLRIVLLQLLGLLTVLGLFFFFQPSPKLVVLGTALLISVLCLTIETRAFSDIERRPWYYKSLALVVLVGLLPIIAITALAQ